MSSIADRLDEHMERKYGFVLGTEDRDVLITAALEAFVETDWAVQCGRDDDPSHIITFMESFEEATSEASRMGLLCRGPHKVIKRQRTVWVEVEND